MRWLRVTPWIALIVFELAIALRSGSLGVLGYVAALVTGGAGAFIYLRRRAASGTAQLASEIDAGRLIWATQVRDGDFGGTLRLYPNLEFRFYPDGWSSKHGAVPKTWPTGTRLSFTETRRDITGVRIQWAVLTPPHGSPRGFDTYGAAGTLPAACVI